MTKDEKKMGLEKQKYAPDETRPAHHLNKKDTKRWCRGKEGREHIIEVIRDPSLHQKRCYWDDPWIPCTHMKRCSVCMKVLVRWLPKEECPDAP